MRRCHLFLPLLFLGCGGDTSNMAADAGVLATTGQGSEARGALVINEFMAKPASGPDWIELYNRSNEEVDLCDFFLTDSLARLDHYLHLGAAPPPSTCEPQMVAAGEYRIILADDAVTLGPGHAPFKLGEADEVHVVSMQGEALDSVIFLVPSDNGEEQSLARIPNGQGLFWPSEPSEGIANRATEVGQ